MSIPFAAQDDGGPTVRFGRGQWRPDTGPGYGRGPQPPQPQPPQPPMPYGGVPGYGVDEETVRLDHLPTAPSAPPRRPRRRAHVWISLLAATLTASGVVAGGFFLLGRSAEAPAAAVVGDCLARDGDGAVIVPCADPQAAFIVLGRLVGRSRIEAGITACSPFPATTDVYWQGKDGVGERGLVLCLGPARK